MKGMVRPVVRLNLALYGHPDAGKFWEEKCDERCREVGFEPIPDWPSCYYHAGWKIVMIVYVDDFKMAGPKQNLPKAWSALRGEVKKRPDGTEYRTGLVIEDPKPAGHFLGCTHIKGTKVLSDGSKVTTMTYDMEPFFQSCIDKYLNLARDCGFTANLRIVATPFLAEDHRDSPQGKPSHEGAAIYCPACRHAFSPSESITDAEWKNTLKELNKVVIDDQPREKTLHEKYVERFEKRQPQR